MSQDIITKPIDCPHCKGKIDVEIPKPVAKVIIKEEQTQTITENHNHSHESQEPKQDEHELLANAMPTGVNFARCKDGKCGHKIIKNAKGLTTEFKTCPTCGDNTNSKKAKICKTCGKKPENPEDWDESEVKIEVEDEEEDDEE